MVRLYFIALIFSIIYWIFQLISYGVLYHFPLDYFLKNVLWGVSYSVSFLLGAPILLGFFLIGKKYKSKSLVIGSVLLFLPTLLKPLVTLVIAFAQDDIRGLNPKLMEVINPIRIIDASLIFIGCILFTIGFISLRKERRFLLGGLVSLFVTLSYALPMGLSTITGISQIPVMGKDLIFRSTFTLASFILSVPLCLISSFLFYREISLEKNKNPINDHST